MIKTFLAKFRCFLYGAVFASIVWASVAYPHVEWRIDAGNQPKELRTALDQSQRLAKLLPAGVGK